MKKLLLLISMLTINSILIFAQKPVKSEISFGINGSSLEEISKNGIIDSTEEAIRLIDCLLLNPKIDTNTKNWLCNHKEKYSEGKTALVIVQHQLKFENTKLENDKKEKWQRSCDSLNSLYLKLKVERKLTDSCRLLLQNKISAGTTQNIIDILYFYQNSLDKLDSAIAGVEKSWSKLQPSFSEGESIVTFVHFHDKYASKSNPETRDYTAYLQGKNIEILYLFIGKEGNINKPEFSLAQDTDPTAEDLSKSIGVLNKMVVTGSVFTDADISTSSNNSNINSNDFTKVKSGSEPIKWVDLNFTKQDFDKSAIEINIKMPDQWEIVENVRARVASVNPDNKVQMSFVLALKEILPDSLEREMLKKVPAKIVSFKNEQIQQHDKINLNIPEDDATYSLEIHKTKCFSLRAGMFGSVIERKLFQLDDSSRLYIQDDTLRNKKFWTNGFLVVEFYPTFLGAGFHNDPDRLGPFWRPNPMVPWYYSRFGIYGGCRLSLKPQEAFVTGLSFLIMDDLHFHIGGMAYQMFKNQNGLKVSSYGDADYWKENAPSKYNWYFSFGITLSPSTFLDTF